MADFLDRISAQSKVNFVVVGNAMDLPISAEMTRTTVVDALLFLKTKGLSYSRIGDSNTFVIRALSGARP